jgi:precorrin-6Y C5,15-methyltransferase (decarboxylating)
VSLACARLGWGIDGVEVLSVVGRPLAAVHPAVQPGRRLVVLSQDAASPAALAALLVARGYGGSPMTMLADLGGPAECQVAATAFAWPRVPVGSDLNVVAVECWPDPGARHLPRTPGLPDDAYEHDGQITKAEVRALTLCRLGPAPGELLWDVGAGSGSIGIEWMRTHSSCRAVAVEPRADRADRVARNAEALGVPGLRVVLGRAPEALAGLPPRPAAVFVGGGLTVPGVLDGCWDALAPGGRLVANAVTVESEGLLATWHARLGGDLVRLSVSRASPVGGFTGWRPMMPVTQWCVTKRRDGDGGDTT